MHDQHAPTFTRDLRSELERYRSEWPPTWKPNPGDTLVGTITQYSQGSSAYGEVHTVMVLDDDEQEWSLWLSSTVLLEQFRRHRPQVGERIGLKYLGKHAVKGYHRYHLVVERPTPADPFAPLGGEAGA